MAQLEFELVGFNEVLRTMTVNGKLAKYSINEKGNRHFSTEISSDKAEVIIYKSNYYTSKGWFWWNLLYFFISIFGLFDMRQSKRFLSIDCRFNILVEKDAKVLLKVNNFQDGGKLLEIETDSKIEEINNIQYFDKVAQKRHKLFKKIKFAIIALTIILAVVIYSL